MDVIIFVLSLMLTYVVFKSLLSFPNRGKKLPPGPFQLPIIGNLTKLGKLPHQSLANLAKLYGPIMYLQLGRVPTIVISSSTLAQQVLQKQDIAFSSRFILDGFCTYDHSKYSMIFLPVGPMWSNLKKIVNLNMFTVNKLDANQHLRSRKVNELIEYVNKCSRTGESVNIGGAAFRTSLNLVSNTIFSKDIADPNEDSAKEFRDLIRDIMVDGGKPNVADFFPVLKKLDPQGRKRKMNRHYEKLIKVIGGLINECFALMRSGDPVEYTDALDELF